MELYLANLNTKGKGTYNDLHGVEVTVMKGSTVDGYILRDWGDEDDSKFMEYYFLAEQNPVFGSYLDDREGFLNDWKGKEYFPSTNVIFAEEDVQIITKWR